MSFGTFYLSDDAGKTIKRTTDDALEWARWFHGARRHVGDDTIDGIRISTVFLGMDHGWGMEDAPVLWETMLFAEDPDLDTTMDRYTSYEDAVAGHARWIERVTARSEEWQKVMVAMGLTQ